MIIRIFMDAIGLARSDEPAGASVLGYEELLLPSTVDRMTAFFPVRPLKMLRLVCRFWGGSSSVVTSGVKLYSRVTFTRFTVSLFAV